jgi:hypothetical protein
MTSEPKAQLDPAQYEQACGLVDELVSAAAAEEKQNQKPRSSEHFQSVLTKIGEMAARTPPPLSGMLLGFVAYVEDYMDDSGMELSKSLTARKTLFRSEYERVKNAVASLKAKSNPR